MRNYFLYIILATAFLFTACEDDYVPKPSGYFMPDLPERSYVQYENEICPCSFEVPVYAEIEQEKYFFDEEPEHPCWLNINFKDMNATIYLSYKDVSDREYFERVIEDSYKMTFKHSQKADFIDEEVIENTQNRVFGYQFDIGGDAASSTQFFLTDSTQHYIRGALYFQATPNIDSVAPVLDFLKTDIHHLIETVQWK